MILLRECYSVRALSLRTGLDVRVLYLLSNGKPTTWTLAIQTQLEALVPPVYAHILAAARQTHCLRKGYPRRWPDKRKPAAH